MRNRLRNQFLQFVAFNHFLFQQTPRDQLEQMTPLCDDLTRAIVGDIPGIGALFRNKNRQSEKAELLIFVTPKILAQSLR